MSEPHHLLGLPDLAAATADSLFRVVGPGGRSATGVPWRAADLVVPLHVAGRADTVDVTSPKGVTFAARVAGRDPSLDLALVRVDGDASVLAAAPPLSWRPSSELRVGTPVLALGRPGATVRAAFGVLGVVGASLRLGAGATIDRYVEIDRHLPRGFSGAPVVDLEGRAIGLAMRGLVRGASLVLGDTTLQRVLGQLAEHGEIQRGYIGVGVHTARLGSVDAERLGRARGVVVVALEETGPASAAGLLLGDVIVAVDDEPVTSPLELRAALEDRGGRHVTLSIIRSGTASSVTVEPQLRSNRCN
jgi:S1-C subfamily serine protease